MNFYSGDFVKLDFSGVKGKMIKDGVVNITPVLSNYENRVIGLIDGDFVVFNSKLTDNLKGTYNIFLVGDFDDENKKSYKLCQVNFIGGLVDTTKSTNEKMIEIIESALEGRIKQEYKSYTINNRTIEKYSPKELLDLLKYYKGQLYKEKINELSPENKARNQLRLVKLIDHEFY